MEIRRHMLLSLSFNHEAAATAAAIINLIYVKTFNDLQLIPPSLILKRIILFSFSLKRFTASGNGKSYSFSFSMEIHKFYKQFPLSGLRLIFM
jgi:hypothetical protein